MNVLCIDQSFWWFISESACIINLSSLLYLTSIVLFGKLFFPSVVFLIWGTTQEKFLSVIAFDILVFTLFEKNSQLSIIFLTTYNFVTYIGYIMLFYRGIGSKQCRLHKYSCPKAIFPVTCPICVFKLYLKSETIAMSFPLEH